MVLYVDETENDKYFIVVGLLMNSIEDTNRAYYSFKRKIRNYKLSNKHKRLVFNEFKSIILDYRFQNIKIKMIETILDANGEVIYSLYNKKSKSLKQYKKENVYIMLLKK